MTQNDKSDDGTSSKTRITTANAVLIACAAHVVLSISDGFFKESLHRYSDLAFWIFDFAKFIAVPIVVLVWLWRAYSITSASYGLRSFGKSDNWAELLGLTLFLAVVLYAAYEVSLHIAWYWASRIFHLQSTAPFYTAIMPDGWRHFTVALYYGVSAGFAEEISFRGLPLLYIRERFGIEKPGWKYVVVTSLLFAAAHWENGPHELVATFAFGVVASVFYLKLRDLRPLVAAHALIDVWHFS